MCSLCLFNQCKNDCFINYTSEVIVAYQTDSKSARNRCVMERFDGIFVLSRCLNFLFV